MIVEQGAHLQDQDPEDERRARNTAGRFSAKQPCVVFTANRGFALSNSRQSLIGRFVQAGWRVVLATSDDAHSRMLRGAHVELEPVTFHRRAWSPLGDWRAYRRLVEICERFRPRLIQSYHAKPMFLGTVAARRVSKSVRIVNTVTGLGRTLQGGRTGAAVAGIGYRVALSFSDITIFQNDDDRSFFVGRKWVKESKARLVTSSGVSMDRFNMKERGRTEPGPAVVVTVTRLLRQKGIEEFVTVARRIREQGIQARFVIAGEEEPGHPDGVSARWLRAQGEVEYLGRVAEVEKLYQSADILLFPSYYREGVPRVVLEAAATGVPTVGFDVAGVRDVVMDGQTGYLVPPRDVEALTRCVKTLLLDGVLRCRFGQNARRHVEKTFNVEDIDKAYLRIYRELGISLE